MQTPLRGGRASAARLALALSVSATQLLACAGESPEPSLTAAPEGPGTITVSRPPKLAARARVPEKEAGFVSAETREHEILITHDGGLSPFAKGDVLGGTQGGGYLAKVEGARALDETHFALQTAPAKLGDFLAEGSFHVHYDAVAPEGAVIEGGGGERIGREGQALKTTPGAPIRLLHVSHASIPAMCGIDTGGKADLDVDADFTPAIDVDVEVGPTGDDDRPDLTRLRIVASGQLDVDARLKGQGTLGGDCSLNLLDLAGGSLSVPLPTLTFWIGPVPVIITTEVAPWAIANLSLSFTRADMLAEAHTKVGLEAGAEYTYGSGWSPVWHPSSSASGKASIGAAGPVDAACRVLVGAEVRARLYGVVGPSIGVMTYAGAHATSLPPYCTYEGQIDGGVSAYVRAEAGFSLGPLDLSLVRLELANLDLVHADGPKFSGKLREAPECGGR
jgi:hypothetical protein